MKNNNQKIPINRQLQANFRYFILFNAMIACLGVGVFIEYLNLRSANEWTAHSSAVQSQIKDLENYAQTAIALRQAAAIDNESDYLSQRQKTFVGLDALGKLVSDNSRQTENIARVRAALVGRFAVQDKLYESQQETNGKLIIDAVQRQTSAAAQSELSTSFYILKTIEQDLLFDRLSASFKAQWNFIYTTIFLLTVIVVFSVWAFVESRKNLLKFKLTSDRLSAGVISHTANGDQILFKKQDYDEILDLIENRNTRWAS